MANGMKISTAKIFQNINATLSGVWIQDLLCINI